MNDRNSIKKIKAIGNFIKFYKGFFFISSITTILMVLLFKTFFEEDKHYISNFVENWNKKPIKDVKFQTSYCDKDYEESTLGNWPVSSTLCDCSDSYVYKLSTSSKVIVKPYQCNMLLRLIGCRNTEEMRKININKWKHKNICVKRSNTTYIDSLYKNEPIYNKDCSCHITDSINKNLCIEECAVTNRHVESVIENKIKKRKFKFNFHRKLKKLKFLNLTTTDDLENIYQKNFNISLNNEILENYAVSEILISEHYPCLISNDFSKIKKLDRLFNFILENLEFIKNDSSRGEGKSSNNYNSSTLFLQNKLDEINLKSLDKKDCYFYENSYFDRRHYVIDIINFYQFLLSDMQDSTLHIQNISLSYEEVSNKDYFTPLTTMFLIASPFYGWNLKTCSENPMERMENIMNLYEYLSWCINIFIGFKISCCVYLTVNGIFEKFSEEFRFAIYIRSRPEGNESSNPFLSSSGTNINSSNFQMICDLVYYFIKICCICLLTKICFVLKNLASLQYLYLIRKDCLDDNSTKILTYLYDVCEEKFIYSLFVTAFNALEFILFTYIFRRSYDLKSSLK